MLALIAPDCMSHLLPWVALYIGPDVFLPIASGLAAVGGVLLMFWQKILGLVGRLLGRPPKPKE
ncbi:MAG TPA: hypothetical protein VN700_10740 [Vicinamibacterales bacterium]|nr:hypothetical protein [Vicinamibacterales bacterium]